MYPDVDVMKAAPTRAGVYVLPFNSSFHLFHCFTPRCQVQAEAWEGMRDHSTYQTTHKRMSNWPEQTIYCKCKGLATELEPGDEPAEHFGDGQSAEGEGIDFGIVAWGAEHEAGVVEPADAVFEEGVGDSWSQVVEDAAEDVHGLIDLPHRFDLGGFSNHKFAEGPGDGGNGFGGADAVEVASTQAVIGEGNVKQCGNTAQVTHIGAKAAEGQGRLKGSGITQ